MFKVYSIKKKFVVCCVWCCSSMSSWQMPYMDMATCFEVDWMIPELLSTVQLTDGQCTRPTQFRVSKPFTTITKPNELDQHCDKKYGIYFPFQWITFNKIHTQMQFWCFKLYMLFSGVFVHTYTEVISFKFSIQMSIKKETFVSPFYSFIEQLETFS